MIKINYFEKWKLAISVDKSEIPPEDYPHNKLKTFVSFILPLMLIPAGIKLAQSIGKAISKKSKDKKKDKDKE